MIYKIDQKHRMMFEWGSEIFSKPGLKRVREGWQGVMRYVVLELVPGVGIALVRVLLEHGESVPARGAGRSPGRSVGIHTTVRSGGDSCCFAPMAA